MALDIEESVIRFLGERLDVEVYADVPANRPARFVTVERTGGEKSDVVLDHPEVAIQCWGTSRADAATLAYEVDTLLPKIAELDCVSRVARNALYNFPDETGNQARYQLYVDFITI